MKHHREKRFEFRIFGRELTAIASRLARDGEAIDQADTLEFYIVPRQNMNCNVKIREGRVDVKLLRGRRGRLELWEPTLFATLPISTASFQDKVGAHLGVKVDLATVCPLGASDIEQVATENPSLFWVPISKKRTKYEITPGWAEFVELCISGRRQQSVAIEARDADAAEELIERFAFGQRGNTNYPNHLRAIALDE